VRRALAPSAVAIGLAALLLLVAALLRAQEPIIADLSNYRVDITTGFVGTDVLVFGAKEGPGDVVVVIRGPTADYAVRRKDRIAGIWVNAELVSFEAVPSFYAVASSRPLDQITTSTVRLRQQIGVDALDLPSPDENDADDLAEFRAAFLRLKQSSGLFAHDIGRVTFLGDRLFRTMVHFPANVPTGPYLVEVLLFRDGEIASAQTVPLTVSKIGIGADVYEFAHRQSAAYGLVAIAGALLAGWAAHLVFRKL
jgi:uncharacterized protein (TIGR02186 family)